MSNNKSVNIIVYYANLNLGSSVNPGYLYNFKLLSQSVYIPSSENISPMELLWGFKDFMHIKQQSDFMCSTNMFNKLWWFWIGLGTVDGL